MFMYTAGLTQIFIAFQFKKSNTDGATNIEAKVYKYFNYYIKYIDIFESKSYNHI